VRRAKKIKIQTEAERAFGGMFYFSSFPRRSPSNVSWGARDLRANARSLSTPEKKLLDVIATFFYAEPTIV
jgi:hypothetical protein